VKIGGEQVARATWRGCRVSRQAVTACLRPQRPCESECNMRQALHILHAWSATDTRRETRHARPAAGGTQPRGPGILPGAIRYPNNKMSISVACSQNSSIDSVTSNMISTPHHWINLPAGYFRPIVGWHPPSSVALQPVSFADRQGSIACLFGTP